MENTTTGGKHGFLVFVVIHRPYTWDKNLELIQKMLCQKISDIMPEMIHRCLRAGRDSASHGLSFRSGKVGRCSSGERFKRQRADDRTTLRRPGCTSPNTPAPGHLGWTYSRHQNSAGLQRLVDDRTAHTYTDTYTLKWAIGSTGLLSYLAAPFFLGCPNGMISHMNLKFSILSPC